MWPDAPLETAGAAAAYSVLPSPARDDALHSILRSRHEMSGPTTAAALATLFAVGVSETEQGLAALEQRGIAMRGRYCADASAVECCDRRLLARIHRYTVNRLRQEIEPVATAAFVRFLAAWQWATPSPMVEGSTGLSTVLRQLSGFETPAATWESEILPARVRGYHGSMLDDLVRAGRCVWLRLSPKRSAAVRVAWTVRTTPIALVLRSGSPAPAAQRVAATAAAPRSPCSTISLAAARRSTTTSWLPWGCCVARRRVRLTNLRLAGLVTCDSYAGLRALTLPVARRNPLGRRRRRTAMAGIEDSGRWDRIDRQRGWVPGTPSELEDCDVETIARALLCRHGSVFRRLLERETAVPPWRLLLRGLRRMEASGEIRGGRFIAGTTGEQFASADAASALRECGRRRDDGGVISMSAVDPLNIWPAPVLPGARIAAHAGTRAVLDGAVVAVRKGG